MTNTPKAAARRDKILNFIQANPNLSSREIHEKLSAELSYATLKRVLAELQAERLVEISGRGKSTRYRITPTTGILTPVDLELYFEKEIDERSIKGSFNHELIPTLQTVCLFSDEEQKKLESLHRHYTANVAELSLPEYRAELERLAIDLSWKSSQIEGNTYSLLETERLLKEKETAAGKTRDEATMLLNHKEALDFIIENPKNINPLSRARIEEIHAILVKDLHVERGIRRRRVGITGTNYRPLDNEFQIGEALDASCHLINTQEDVFSKSLLAMALISYIQAFNDGNKRTGRIIGNALLMAGGSCPISFRTVDPITYKKAMLVFYEQNNISALKRTFIEQFAFAVETYF